MEHKEEGRTSIGSIIAIIILLCIIGFLIWWFGFRNNTTTSTNTTANQPTVQQKETAIRNNWVSFFSGQTTAGRKVALLQNGQEFAPVINAQAQTPTAKAITASVSSVTLNNPSQATVTYTVYINGKPALQNQKGQAVYQNSTWKVSDAAFCGLLQLSGSLPPNCPGGSQSGSGTSGQTPPSQSTGAATQTPAGTAAQ